MILSILTWAIFLYLTVGVVAAISSTVKYRQKIGKPEPMLVFLSNVVFWPFII